MRGQPSVQLLFVLLAFAALGMPVWRLTRSAGAAPPGIASGSPTVVLNQGVSGEETLAVAAVFTPAPEEFHLQSLGRDVLAGRGPQGEFSGAWRTPLPLEGLDLALQARWPSTEAPTAVRVTVRFPDDRAPVEKTFWTPRGGTLVELVTVPGGTAKPE